MTIAARLEERSIPVPWSGCTIWLGGTNQKYGLMRVGPRHENKQEYVHRLAYQLQTGQPIPDGFEVCHKCDITVCINPNHLFLGTESANMLDSVAKNRHRWKGRTHCLQGHELTNNNLTKEVGRKRCLTCFRTYQNNYQKQRRQKP